MSGEGLLKNIFVIDEDPSYQTNGGLQGFLKHETDLPLDGLVVVVSLLHAGALLREGGQPEIDGQNALHGKVGATGDLAGAVNAAEDLGAALFHVGRALALGQDIRFQDWN